MFENKLANCLTMSVLFRGMKFLIFIALLVIVVDQYAIDIYTKFQKKSTVFVSKTSEFENFTSPPISICFKNPFKPSGLEKYGITSRYGFIMGTGLNRSILSVWNTYVEVSYLLNRDFGIEIHPCTNAHSFQLLVGINNIKCVDGRTIFVEVNEYYTMTSGTCYGIRSDLQISPPTFASMNLYLNESLPNEDFPEVCYEYYEYVGDS